jgi:hypothetical protein
VPYRGEPDRQSHKLCLTACGTLDYTSCVIERMLFVARFEVFEPFLQRAICEIDDVGLRTGYRRPMNERGLAVARCVRPLTDLIHRASHGDRIGIGGLRSLPEVSARNQIPLLRRTQRGARE